MPETKKGAVHSARCTMGGERQEEKREGDEDREREGEDQQQEGGEKLRVGEERVSGPSDSPFRVAKAQPLPSLPDTRHPRGISEHADSHMDRRQPDEQAVDWRNYVTASGPGNALPTQSLLAGAEPEAPNRSQDKLDPAFRARSWDAYSVASQQVDDTQRSLGPDYAAFMQAQDHPDLHTLGFVKPSHDWKGNAGTFADKQNVLDDTRLGSLFRPNGGLNASPDDQAGMAKASEALRHGVAKDEHDATIGDDHLLRAAKLDFDGERENVKLALDDINSARRDIYRVHLTHEVAEDREALEQAKGHAEDVKSTIEFIFGGAFKYLVTGPEEAADSMESFGAMVSYAVSKVSNRSIETAEAKLRVDTKKLQDEEANKALDDYQKAKGKASVALKKLGKARQQVLAAMNARKAVYVKAGRESAQASGGDASTRAKIAGFIAAIPTVEAISGMLRNLVMKVSGSPASYSPQAGTGFAMAVHAQRTQPTHFVTALGHLAYLKGTLSEASRLWDSRLAALQKARTQLGGERAADSPDTSSASSTHKAGGGGGGEP